MKEGTRLSIEKPQKCFPLYVDFAVTYKCNAKCQHCSLAANYYKESNQKCEEMNTQQVYNIIDELSELGILLIGFTGGEAILREDIYDIIQYTNNKGILSAIASNGLAMTPNRIDRLIDCNIGSVFFSLDHYDAQIHNHIRGEKHTYESVIKAIRYCVKKGVFVTVGITPMKDNYLEIEKTIDFIDDLGVKTINISNFVPTGRGIFQYDLTPTEWREFHKIIEKCKKKYNHIRFQVHDVRRNIYLHDEKRKDRYQGCTAGFEHCYILPNGDIRPCVMLPIKLGNIFEEPLKDILIRYQQSDYVINKNKLKGKCGKCKFKYECGGCRANAYAYFNDPQAEDPHCWIGAGEKRG